MILNYNTTISRYKVQEMMRFGSGALFLKLNSIGFVFFLVLINQVALFLKVEADCKAFCGELSKISYPFRVQDDPKHCGEADYELVCEGDEALFYTGAHRYLVTYIEYPSGLSNYFGRMTIHVDCLFTSGTCRLHQNYYSNFIHKSRNTSPIYSWASFVNCSQKIENIKQFANRTMLLPVPSAGAGNTTHYVVFGENEILDLHKSCKLVDTFLFTDDYRNISSSGQVFDVLQKGFNLLWTGYFLNTKIGCWTQAFRLTNGKIKQDYSSILLYPIYYVFNFFSCLWFKACQIHRVDYGNNCHINFEKITFILQNILDCLSKLMEISRLVLGPLIIFVYLLYYCWKNTRRLDTIEKFLQKQVLLPRRYSYGEITIMSKNFREKLGKGGFGQVYKGELFGGHPIAIKILDGLQFNGEDFINEVSTIGMIHHVNIVQLLGYCSEGTKRALIYEYMPNGSLDRYIFSSHGESTCISLTLEKLTAIALGIAKGINYLHTGCDMQILHFDIKPHNILLDDNFVPKVSDFGLAKLYPKEQSLVSVSAARGTIGYIAPELISRSFGVISHKSDVYSFGMLILEIAGIRRNFDTRAQNSKEVYYPSWIYGQLTQLEESNFDEITEIEEIGELEKRLCKVGLWCIQINPFNRPTMSEVVKLLESDVDDIEMPPKPFFLTTDAVTEEHSHGHSSSLSLPVVDDAD